MFIERWRAISARIDGIESAATLMARYLAVKSSEPYGVERNLGQMCFETLEELNRFADAFTATLPQLVEVRIRDFCTQRRAIFEGGVKDAEQARAAIVLIVAIRAEVSFLLADQQEQLHKRTERGFMHLKRVLAANPHERKVWQNAYDSGGEVACEALGGAHLLSHGLFAFKVHGVGARTDLVFPEPFDLEDAARGGAGLILTEWKTADDKTAEKQFETARAQADLYKEGVLSGVELASFRYLLAVSVKPLPASLIPTDVVTSGGITYRHLNIAITPLTPSVAAKTRN